MKYFKPNTIKSDVLTTALVGFLFLGSALFLKAQTEIKPSEVTAKKDQVEATSNTIEVEVKYITWSDLKSSKAEGAEKKDVLVKETLYFVSYNKDKTLFVGYYQDGWYEMVSLHDAKTKKQIGSAYCGGGIPREYRFSKDNKFLGGKASVGWYVWKIPSFEKVLILGDLDFNKLTIPAEPDAGVEPDPKLEKIKAEEKTVYLSVDGMC